MAWFRRKRDDASDVDEATPTEVSPSGASGASGDSDIVRASRSQAGDWMAMPPMHMTVGPPPSTFKVQRLSEIMTTRRPMAFMGQLGHQVSSSAPAGRVEGLASTVAPPTAAPHPIDLPLHGHLPHHEEPADAPVLGAPPAEVQRSVRDLAPDEPVTAQTLGVSRQAEPVVQRALSATSAPAAPAAPSRSALPEPSPSRVLREPTRAPSPLESRVPPIPVVGDAAAAPAAAAPPSPVADDAVASGDFVVPDAPVEFVVRAGDPTPVAPLTGDAPLQRSAASDDAGTSDAAARTEPLLGRGDLPLVAPSAAAADLPLASPPASVSREAAPAGEMMPPIQPRAIQRRAEAASSTRGLTGDSASPAGLPPLPSWATGDGGATESHVAPSVPPDMPLRAAAPAPSTGGTRSLPLQREAMADDSDEEHFEGDGHDHGGTEGGAAVQREADPSTGSPAVDVSARDETAPLVGATALVDQPSPSGDHTDASSSAIDMPLQALAAPGDSPLQRSSDGAPGPAPSAAATSAATSSDAAPASDEVEEPTVAPLLGERPLQLQRVDRPSAANPAGPGPSNALPLPLVADVASGPALDSTPSPRSAPTSPDASGTSGPVASAIPPASGGSAPLQRTLAAGPIAQTLVQRSIAATAGASPASSATRATSPSSPSSAPASPSAASLPLRTLSAAPAAAGGAVGAAQAASIASSMASSPAAAFGSDPWAPAPSPASVSSFSGDVAVQTLPEAGVAMPLQDPSRPAPDGGQLLGDAAVAAGLGHRAPDGSVVFSRGGAATSGVSVPIQREADGGALPVQMLEDTSSFTVQREWKSATPSASKETADEDKELDEMAAKLYDRIRRKLAAELRADQRRLGAASWKGR